ncbi:hypothetical protein [Nocardia aurea]|uniref:hypothetical protein n=1 Tax=Nocardia aurea TaxID=2144174 RepID=UPI00130071E7|nr:hypothetical protein [Nocardia aurea]
MSSVARKPRGPGASRPDQRPARVMGMPDILAMTTAGALPPGKKITLPSGAIWKGGQAPGTSTITFPDEDPLFIDTGEHPGAVSGTPVREAALARVFQGVLGVMPKIFADWVGPGSDRGEQSRTSTRLLRMTARTTFHQPFLPGQVGGEHDDSLTDADTANRTPLRRAGGGLVSGPGGPRDDSILARLSDGEYVVNAAATSQALPLLEAINAGRLPGYASGGLVDTSPHNSMWRDLIASNLARPVVPDRVSGADFGLFGLVGDAFGAIADSALNAGGRAGSMLGAAIAPLFGPGGVVGSSFVAPSGASDPSQTVQRPLSGRAPNPLSAWLGFTPEGPAAFPAVGLLPGLGSLLSGTAAGTDTDGVDQMARLAEALGQGIESVATDAGGKVGAALGSALGPALGPSGALAPEIGAQLGAMIGSKFGGSLRASMTMTGTTSGNAATDSASGTPAVDSGAVAPEAGAIIPSAIGTTSGSSASSVPSVSSRGQMPVPGDLVVGADGIPVQYISPGRVAPARYVREGGTVQSLMSALRQDAPKTLGDAVPRAGSLVDTQRLYDPFNGSVADFAQVAGAQLGADLGFGVDQGRDIGDLLGGAAAALDPNGQWSPTLAAGIGNLLGIEFRPDAQNAMTRPPSAGDQIGFAAVMGAVQGAQQHGLVGGLTGAISGAASTAGSMLGTAAGTALAGFLGPLAPLAPAIGGAIGSMAGSMLSGLVTEPIEYAAQTAKEVIGTGFGLTDLAEGPGGYTPRQDIFNFNGMDPKSAAMAVERVNRRRTLAQQRGGGLGR